MFENLISGIKSISSQKWQDLLLYSESLYKKSVNDPSYPLKYPFIEYGPGYCFRPGFGHLDLAQEMLDILPYNPELVKLQVLNFIFLQKEDGMIPGAVFMPGPFRDKPKIQDVSCPPLWIIAAQKFYDIAKDTEFIKICFGVLKRQLKWFDKNRRTSDGGFYYTDIINNSCESGIDINIRFDHPSKSGFFHDRRSIVEPKYKTVTFAGFWPLISNTATNKQANSVIENYILNPKKFNTAHPIPYVSIDDPGFELKMWRGPTWNSLTYWTAIGCVNYHRYDAAKLILEKALSATAEQFEKTGTIWEFYHPDLDSQELLERKPESSVNSPCTDYLGHNPLLAMTNLWYDIKNK